MIPGDPRIRWPGQLQPPFGYSDVAGAPAGQQNALLVKTARNMLPAASV
jgi:hypothetical protein